MHSRQRSSQPTGCASCNVMASNFADRRRDMELDGFTVFEGVYSSEIVERLRHAIDDVALQQPDALAAFEKNPFQGIWPINRSAEVDSTIAEVLGADGARQCLARVGVVEPRFSSGYSLSKPPHSPALYWHRDWHYWSERESDAPMGTQLFLMVYLVDTTPTNGCLRVLPGSHLRRVALDDVDSAPSEAGGGSVDLPTAEGQGNRWSHRDWAADLKADPSLPETVQHAVTCCPGALDVAVRAGDLIVGDSRLYHCAYANRSDTRRTCITSWYVDWDACGPALRAAYSRGADHGGSPCGLPCATDAEVALLAPLHPSDDGDAKAAFSSRALGDWGVGARAISVDLHPRL